MAESAPNMDAHERAAQFFHANYGKVTWPEKIGGVDVDIYIDRRNVHGRHYPSFRVWACAKSLEYPDDFIAVGKLVGPLGDNWEIDDLRALILDMCTKLRADVAVNLPLMGYGT